MEEIHDIANFYLGGSICLGRHMELKSPCCNSDIVGYIANSTVYEKTGACIIGRCSKCGKLYGF